MVLATQCPARHSSEKGEMDMYPEHGLGRSLFSALNTIGRESGHPELANAKLIVLGFSGTSADFGHFVAYAPERVLAAILANPGADDPDNVDRIRLDENSIAVPLLIIVGGVDTISGTANHTNSSTAIAQREPLGFISFRTKFLTAASTIQNHSCSIGSKR